MSITAIQNYSVQNAGFEADNSKVRVKHSNVVSQTCAKTDCIELSNKCASKKTNGIDEILVKYAPNVYMGKYLNRKVIENALELNPNIKEILKDNGLEPKIYMENITGKSANHFKTTYDAAKKASSDISDREYTILLQASLLHDIGKALIPASILNKPGKLDEAERKIVDLHSILGAEILKTTDVNQRVIDAVYLHHTEYSHPVKSNNEIAQILSAADVYSALKEERPYKPKMDDDKVRAIMQNDAKLNPKFSNRITAKNNQTVPIYA